MYTFFIHVWRSVSLYSVYFCWKTYSLLLLYAVPFVFIWEEYMQGCYSIVLHSPNLFCIVTTPDIIRYPFHILVHTRSNLQTISVHFVPCHLLSLLLLLLLWSLCHCCCCCCCCCVVAGDADRSTFARWWLYTGCQHESWRHRGKLIMTTKRHNAPCVNFNYIYGGYSRVVDLENLNISLIQADPRLK